MALRLADTKPSWQKGHIKNEFLVIGKWFADEYAVRLGEDPNDWLPVYPLPSHIGAYDNIQDGAWIQVKGMLFCGELTPPELLPQQVTAMAVEPSFCQYGVIDVDVSSWIDGAIQGQSATGRSVVVNMPKGHCRAALRHSAYMVGNRVRVRVEVRNDFIVATEVLSVTRIDKIGLEAPKSLHGCQAMMDWQRQQTGTVRRPRGRTSISPRLRKEVFMRDGFKCCHCGATPASKRHVFLEIDHIIPVARGGGNSMDNLQTLCSICNNGKSDHMDPLKAVLAREAIADPWGAMA